MISARVDGELGALESTRLDAHLAGCATCAERQEAAWALRRSLNIAPAAATPASPVSPAPLAVPLAAPRGHEVLRLALFVIGGTLVLLNARQLLGWGVDVLDHAERHGSVFGAALGVAMVVVGARPHRAIGLVPFTTTAMLLMLIVIVVDLVNGSARVGYEAMHLVELAGLVCVWVISGGFTRLVRLAGQLGSS